MLFLNTLARMNQPDWPGLACACRRMLGRSDQRADDVAQLLLGERFGQIDVSARKPPLEAVYDASAPREHHQGDMGQWGPLPQAQSDLIAVEMRHLDVQQDQVW